MTEPKVFSMKFSQIYEALTKKVERKDRTRSELDSVITWLTGYSVYQLEHSVASDITLREFFDNAPEINPNASKITGVICGYRVEDITDPLMQRIRWMDKLADELAKGKALEKIYRD